MFCVYNKELNILQKKNRVYYIKKEDHYERRNKNDIKNGG